MKVKTLVSICSTVLLLSNSQSNLNAEPTMTIARVPADIIGFKGTANVNYILQTSTNMTRWQNLALILGNSTGTLGYTNIPSGNMLFYRAIQAGAATLSMDTLSPNTSTVVVDNTTTGTSLGLPVLIVDVTAQSTYGLQLRTLRVGVSCAQLGNTATVTAAYLYQGSTLVMSSAVVNGEATFANIASGTAGSIIPANTTVPYTIKIDVAGITSGSAVVTATMNGNDQSILSTGETAQVIGNVTGPAITIVGLGPAFSQVGTPTIIKQELPAGGSGNTVFSYSATFNVTVMAVGEDVSFGLPGSSAPSFAAVSSLTSIYVNNFGNDAMLPTSNMVVTYTQPANTTLSADGTQFVVAQNQSVLIAVTYSFVVTNPGANVYAVQLEGIRWAAGGTNSITPFNDQPSWRTPSL